MDMEQCGFDMNVTIANQSEKVLNSHYLPRKSVSKKSMSSSQSGTSSRDGRSKDTPESKLREKYGYNHYKKRV